MKCNYCGQELIDGNLYCVKCGRKNEKELNKEEVEQELANEKRTSAKTKVLMIVSIILLLVICSIGFIYIGFSVKATNIASDFMELNQKKTEKYLSKSNSLICFMAKNKINKEIKKLSKDYIEKNTYKSDFYDTLANVLDFDKSYKTITGETVKCLPTIEYAFKQMSYDIGAESVVHYINSLDRFDIKNSDIKEDVEIIYNSYSDYSDAETAFNNNEYLKVVEICNAIHIYEKDTDLKEKVKKILGEASAKYGEVVSQDLVNTYEQEDYAKLFDLLESLKTVNETEYDKYYNDYIIKCSDNLEKLIQNNQYEAAFNLAKILYEQRNSEYSEKLLLCYENYMNYLIDEANNEDLAKEITSEMMVSFANNEIVVSFNNYFNLEVWKKEYKKLLSSLSDTCKFALYDNKDREVPFLLKMDGNCLTVYGVEGDNCVELASLNNIMYCDNNEYVVAESNSSSGYFEETQSENYYVYEVTNTGEILQKYVLSSIYSYQYYAFTNERYNQSYSYQKDGEAISESKYNSIVKKFTSDINGFNDITDENIQKLILKYSTKEK